MEGDSYLGSVRPLVGEDEYIKMCCGDVLRSGWEIRAGYGDRGFAPVRAVRDLYRDFGLLFNFTFAMKRCRTELKAPDDKELIETIHAFLNQGCQFEDTKYIQGLLDLSNKYVQLIYRIWAL